MELARLNEQQFQRFRDFIYARSGIWVDDRKVTLLTNRIRQRAKAGGFADFDAYYRRLTSPAGAGELGHFLDAITTNETYFFRTPQHFDWLRTAFISTLLDEQREGSRGKSFRIWSAGCASGAEPYTIAICLAENRFRLPGWDWTILGTDLSERVLATAREGVFREKALEGVSESQLRRFFGPSRHPDARAVKPEIRDMVRFEQHNLMNPAPDGPFDCIFIRNVLIYFDRDSKRAVVENLIAALADRGCLIVGPSEGIYDLLGGLRRESTFVCRKV